MAASISSFSIHASTSQSPSCISLKLLNILIDYKLPLFHWYVNNIMEHEIFHHFIFLKIISSFLSFSFKFLILQILFVSVSLYLYYFSRIFISCSILVVPPLCSWLKILSLELTSPQAADFQTESDCKLFLIESKGILNTKSPH